MSSRGYQYSPVVSSAQLISATITNSLKYCAIACNTNPLCRIFDFGALTPQECRLFQGDVDTLGNIIVASRFDSIVGTIEITSSLFTQYGQQCSSICDQSRYLTCINSICQCTSQTYWDSSSSICRPQSPILGGVCQQGINMCREDLNYTCLQFNQCGPLSVLSGTTIADRNTVINGSSVTQLGAPQGITMYGIGENESLVIIAPGTRQVVHIQNINSNNTKISGLVRTNNTRNGFDYPTECFVDTKRMNDLYVSDYSLNFVVLFSSMQMNNPTPRVVAGINQTYGSGLHEMKGALGIAVDQAQNIYVADKGNHRIMRWAPNATNGVIIAGRGTSGSDSMSFNEPSDIFLDETNSLLYVADMSNYRIQVFRLNGTPPYNGTTVAGGNGGGSGSHQLNMPTGLWVSKKTGAIYIADQFNHRIQRWSPGASSGVTVAGHPFVRSGSTATQLYYPYDVVLNSDETYMYVSDWVNRRIQRFDVI